MTLTTHLEEWPIDGVFRISREAYDVTPVVMVELTADGITGRGEACGVRYHGETQASIAEQIDGVRVQVEAGLSREALQSLLPPGGARNAIDCALWDLEAKRSGTPAWQLAGLDEPQPLTTAYTFGLDDPAALREKVKARAGYRLFKIKLGTAEGDVDRVRAVRDAAPDATLIVDANEGWSYDQLMAYALDLNHLGVRLIEQPLPAGSDAALDAYDGPVPLCADESCQTTASLVGLSPGYAFVNIKLDKTGGLTEALRLMRAAEQQGRRLMVGCMVGTSLSMAPATLVAQRCEFVDLDGPLLQRDDRDPAIRYEGSTLHPPPRALWG